MNKTLIAGAIMALVSTGAIAAKPVRPPPPPDLTPRVEALEQKVGVLEQEVGVLKQQVGALNAKDAQLQTELSGNQQEIADLKELVTSIHGPTLPPTEPPVIPPMPEGGYAVYDADGDFVGTTSDGSRVRITFAQYPGIYFTIPAFEWELLNWTSETWGVPVIFPDSNDCSTQPYLLSGTRYGTLLGANLLNPTPAVNTNEGPIWMKPGSLTGSITSFYIADPNNEAEARTASGNGSWMHPNGSCSGEDISRQYPRMLELKAIVPAYEVTIDPAYPLQVIFD